MTTKLPRRYICLPCDALVDADPCPACGADTEDAPRPRKLTRQEFLEGLADSGVDTFEDYRMEK